MKSYKVTAEFTALNPTTGKTKLFSIGDTIQAEIKTGLVGVGSQNGLITSDGFNVPLEYVQEIKTPVLLYVGIAVILIVVVFFIVKYIRK